MKTVRIYGFVVGQSAWGNGGAYYYFLDEVQRDKNFKRFHWTDQPVPFEFDAAEIDGQLYHMPKIIELTK